MKVQELIDKIQEIRDDCYFSDADHKEDLEDCLRRIRKICDNILIDWKMENARCLMNSSEKH